MLTVFALCIFLIIIVIAIHLMTFKASARYFTSVHEKMDSMGLLRLSVVIIWMLLAHWISILVFSVGLWFLIGWQKFGELVVDPDLDIADIVYFSAVTYTSLGYGDLTPTGDLRIFAAMEVLTGVGMMALTASFLFLMLQRFSKRI